MIIKYNNNLINITNIIFFDTILPIGYYICKNQIIYSNPVSGSLTLLLILNHEKIIIELKTKHIYTDYLYEKQHIISTIQTETEYYSNMFKDDNTGIKRKIFDTNIKKIVHKFITNAN